VSGGRREWGRGEEWSTYPVHPQRHVTPPEEEKTIPQRMTFTLLWGSLAPFFLIVSIFGALFLELRKHGK
jgi:hypothetical protein